MIRRSIAALAALLMLAVGATALADGIQVFGLCQGETVIGTAVLLGDRQTLLTSLEAARITDHAVDVTDACYEPADMRTDGYAALLLFDTEIDAVPLLLAPETPDIGLFCVGATLEGELVREPVTRIAPYRFNGHAAIVFSAAEGLMPGAVLLDGEGNVAGLMTAAYGEGKGRYVAYTNEGLYFVLNSLRNEVTGSGLIAAPRMPAQEWVTEPAVSWTDGLLTVDWSACEIPDRAEDSVFTAILQDLGNPFYLYNTAAQGSTSCSFPAVPGRLYAVWVRHDHGQAHLSGGLDAQACVVFGPEPVQPFARYDYADESIWVSAVPAGTPVEDTEVLPEAKQLTADMLDGSQDVYLQVVSRYQVTEQLESSLLVSLTAPDGEECDMLSGFIYAPEYMTNDCWHAPITELFDVLRQYSEDGALASGQYIVSYYLDGLLANQVSFTLE